MPVIRQDLTAHQSDRRALRAGIASLPVLIGVLAFVSVEVGCAGKSTQLHEGQSYPYTADLLNPIEVMVYREGPTVELVNHTVHSYKDFNLWINERYVRQIPRLEAGASISVSLHEFSDEHGEAFRAGGLLSTRKPEPLTKAEIETDEGLIGLLVVRLDRP